MKNKNMIWLSLVCGIILACSPVLAQGPQNGAPAPPPNGERLGPPPGQQPGSRPGSPLPPLSHMDPNDRDAQRTVPGPYRLTFTITEMDGSNKVNSQHYVVLGDADAPPTDLRLGTKIPIETGASGSSTLPALSQITYVDVGLNIHARLQRFANGVELSSNISQSAIDSHQPNPKSPVIRQTSLQSTVLLTENKPTVLGTMDELGSNRRLEIQVELTKIP